MDVGGLSHRPVARPVHPRVQPAAETTRRRAEEDGLSLEQLPPWYDVDDEVGLRRLRRDLARSRRMVMDSSRQQWLIMATAPLDSPRSTLSTVGIVHGPIRTIPRCHHRPLEVPAGCPRSSCRAVRPRLGWGPDLSSSNSTSSRCRSSPRRPPCRNGSTTTPAGRAVSSESRARAAIMGRAVIAGPFLPVRCRRGRHSPRRPTPAMPA